MQKVPAPLPVGTVIRGRYLIEDLLGQGSSGAVYLVKDQHARDAQCNLFALKEVINSKQEERSRFALEGAVFRQLHHWSISRVYHVFNDDKQDRVYLLMEYIEGQDLETLRQQQPEKRFSWYEIMSIMAPIIAAVSYLHHQELPIIHRDIKPANLIVPKAEAGVVLVDYGIVKEFDPNTPTVTAHSCSLNYKAPEFYSSDSDRRIDIYGLGATFYTLLTGAVPPDALSRLAQLDSEGIDPLKAVNEVVPTVPARVARAISQAMALQPSNRFSSVEQFWEALWSLVEYSSPPSGRTPSTPSSRPVVTNQVTQPVPVSVLKLPQAPRFWKLSAFWPSPPKQVGARPATLSVPKQSIVPEEEPVEQLSPLSSASVDSSIVTPQPQPATPMQGDGRPLQERLRASRSRRLDIFICALFGLFTALAVGASLWSYAVVGTAAHSVTPTPQWMGVFHHTATPTSQPAVTSTAIPATPAPAIPMLAASYKGTIHNTSLGVISTMSLTNVKQHGRNMSGYLTLGLELLGNGPFRGTVDTAQHIQFTVPGVSGNGPLHFYGIAQPDGSLKGSYCSLDQTNHCNPGTGGSGTWSIQPV